MYGFRNLLDDETLNGAIRNLLAESEKMIPLGRMKILPLAVEILTETHTLIPKHHIYQAGAPQIATCKVSRSNTFVSADKQLHSTHLAVLNSESPRSPLRLGHLQ